MNQKTLVILSAVLTLAVSWSGCVSDEDAQRPNPPTETVPALTFSESMKVIELPNVQSESFVAVSDDADVRLTCLHGEFKEPSIMLASTDAGATWRELEATPSPGVGGDCEVALTGDAGWHFVHTQAAGIVVASTFDEGETWRVNYATGPPVATFSDRPWLQSYEDSLVLSYAGYAGIQVRTSHDEGATWNLPQVVAQPRPGHLSLPGHLKIASDGKTVIQPYLQVPASGSGEGVDEVYPGVAVSTDLGETWTDHELEAVEAMRYHPAAAVAGDGTIHYTYFQANGSVVDLVVRSSTDLGATWSGPRILDPGLDDVGRAWTEVRADGTIDLLYMSHEAPNATAEATWIVKFLRADPYDAVDPATTVVAVEPFQYAQEFVSFTYDGSGRAHIVYTVVTGGSLTQAPPDGSALWTVVEKLGRPMREGAA